MKKQAITVPRERVRQIQDLLAARRKFRPQKFLKSLQICEGSIALVRTVWFKGWAQRGDDEQELPNGVLRERRGAHFLKGRQRLRVQPPTR